MNTVRRGATALLALALLTTAAAAQTPRPMTWMDIQTFARAGSWAPSPDRQWMLYTITKPDWEDAQSYSDIHLVSLARGVSSSRQMTFTEKKNEQAPAWAPGGAWFVFSSDRDAAATARQSQLYMMRPDGGEARKITDAKDGVSNFDFSPDGKWLAFRAGKSGEEQLWRLSVAGIPGAEAEQLTKGKVGVGTWEWAPDSRRIYFVRDDTVFTDDKTRRDKKFTVDIKNDVTPLASLWALDAESKAETKLASDPSYSVSGFEISPDGKWVAFTGSSSKRYERNITEERMYADQYLLEVASGGIERLTNNREVGEGGASFSPDSRRIAFSAPDDMTRYSMTESRVYLREAGAKGQPFRKLGSSFDGSVGADFWSEDGKTIYFTTGIKVTAQLFALDVATGAVTQVTNERATVRVGRDEDTGVILIDYADPRTPSTVFTVTALDRVADRQAWIQLVDATPEVKGIALGETVEVEWRSRDGKRVGGVLTYPVGYQKGQRYPLIVAIHGGPAAADMLGFNGGYGAQVYAGAGWAVLMPNYRGSTGYGNAHRVGIVGDYFTKGYEDIMTGVDHLIAEGIVDGARMGALGWSAGGHWSNWILTHTNRFKAISSGAGTMNWVSMYAQSDVQRNRQFYLGDGFLYNDNFDRYFDQSPLKYVKNAKTPTMIHVVEGDPRVPSPQSVELHMALKKLGVDTELFMYPGRSHGIPDPRNRLVKSVAEMAWMDFYVLGKGEKFQWRQVLETLKEDKPAATGGASR
ncbi:MAG TPA: prolyl oligopeptidase family serine peptidase [Longimicrobiales bacterium]|nr:prolyl oligopeptidase family serine peptidase [Longimicrobiales bacterium]